MPDLGILSATAGYLVRGNEICLAIKRRKMAAGLRMPYGGVVNDGETEEECMIRELREESGLVCSSGDLQKVGFLSIRRYHGNGNLQKMLITIYLIHDWMGDPIDTDEMEDARWFHKDDLPLQKMLPADREWLPIVLAGKNVIVRHVIYTRDYWLVDSLRHPHVIDSYNRPPWP